MKRPLAHYDLVEEIGRGGMGVVYRAIDQKLGREVAVKVLPEELVGDPSRRARLLLEARTASSLEHPNIAVVHEVGEADGTMFIVMEFIRGRALSEMLAEGALPPPRALTLATEIAEGLARAHDRRVVHRDVKPGNVMVTDDGHAKLVDFGLARVMGPAIEGSEATAETTPALTRDGAVVGTTAYMAPEQARAGRVDHRADVFACGATIFEMVTGRAAFRRPTEVDTLQAILSEPVPAILPVAGLTDTLAADLQRIVAKCTQKDPDERYQGMRDLAVDLRAARRLMEASGDSTSSRSSVPVVDPLAAVAVLPFADMSPARDQDYLCEGFAEELILALSRIDGLRVAARTASFQFRGATVDVGTAGRRLGVGSLVEGSVRKAGDRLRVTVQLIEVATGYQRWSQRFDRRLDDVFAIQDEIAESVAASLRGTVLSGREKQALARPHTAPVAYEHYLRGRQLLPRMTRSDLEDSRAAFERALELDPLYAPAWAGVAAVHATLYEWFGALHADLARADLASARALELAPELAEAHVSRGFVLSLGGHYDNAAACFDAAIRLDPHLFDAYYYYARACFAGGAIARAAELFGRAADVRREDFQSPMLCSQAQFMLGRAEQAAATGREGIRRAERMLALNPTDVRALSLGSGALVRDGQVERARQWMARAVELNPEDAGVLVNAACLHAKLGEKDDALALLERVFARGWGKRDWIEHDPDYDILRDDPRFLELLAKLK